ncbi:MAG TPA: nucleotidyl transferase AbiEii/AbiGii toxin family protein [Chloroflexota bacterium]|nr:nucleotidyl transferase AbiEii/AbiGii toxin family protein [Chloroflexota bacterium]
MSDERPTSRDWSFVRALRQTVDVLNAAEIPYLIAGGLAAKAYGKRRTTHDIDLFVKQSDAVQALKVLEKAGFTTEITYPTWLYKAFKYDVMVDIIFKSAGNITVDDETLSRARPMDYRGRRLPLVPPETLMLMKIFALHYTRAANTHWRHWRDALSVLRSVPMDWDFLYRKAMELDPRIVLGFLLLAEVEGVRADNPTVARLCLAVASGAGRPEVVSKAAASEQITAA